MENMSKNHCRAFGEIFATIDINTVIGKTEFYAFGCDKLFL